MDESYNECIRSAAQILFAVLVLLIVLYYYGMHTYSLLDHINVPGPKPWPWLGNIPEVINGGGLNQVHFELFKKYGSIYKFSLARTPGLVVADPEMLREILVKQFPKFTNRSVPVKPIPPMDSGVAAAEGEQWKRIRKILSPTFSASKMRDMEPFIDAACNTLTEKLEEVARTGQTVDILEYFKLLTLDFILSTAFGMSTDVQKCPDTELVQRINRAFNPPWYAVLFMVMPRFIAVALGKIATSLRGDLAHFETVASEIIAARRTQGNTGRRDLLHLLMTAHEETTDQGYNRLSDEEIIAQVITFLMVGQESSSNTLSFVAYQLAMNPDVQERLQIEIDQAVKENPDTPLYDLIHNLPYLDCVIDETFRIFPPGYVYNRMCSEDCTINGLRILAGTEVTIPVYSLHHDPKAWPEPSKFDPERFRDGSKASRHPYQFLPFGVGPRNCIGMRFALLEVKMALVRILREFSFVRCPETQSPLALKAAISLAARDGVYVRIKSRRETVENDKQSLLNNS